MRLRFGDGVFAKMEDRGRENRRGFSFLTLKATAGVPNRLVRAYIDNIRFTQPSPPACNPADMTTTGAVPGNGYFGVPDGTLSGADISYFVEGLVNQDRYITDLTTRNTNPGDANYGVADGLVDGSDISYFVEQYVQGCN